ncbi:response regulator transcription factor [bacterium]|nr:response regulator transcription factor [bacterium]
MQNIDLKFDQKKHELLKRSFDPRFEYVMCSGILDSLVAGKTYREIARAHYLFSLNKVIYRARKMREKTALHNRRQLAYFAVVNGLVDLDTIFDECI